jgi:integrase
MDHPMRDAMRAAELPDDCTLHGLRYTFATRTIELGLDRQTIESIVGHKTAEMAVNTPRSVGAWLAIATLDAARQANRQTAILKTAADRSENRSGLDGDK